MAEKPDGAVTEAALRAMCTTKRSPAVTLLGTVTLKVDPEVFPEVNPVIEADEPPTQLVVALSPVTGASVLVRRLLPALPVVAEKAAVPMGVPPSSPAAGVPRASTRATA